LGDLDEPWEGREGVPEGCVCEDFGAKVGGMERSKGVGELRGERLEEREETMSREFLRILRGWIELLIRRTGDEESADMACDMIRIAFEGGKGEIEEIPLRPTMWRRGIPL
jgi:hypothetical protein